MDGAAGQNQKSEMNSAVIIIDSHGNSLEKRKMYKSKRVKVEKLAKGMKNIEGAKRYIRDTTEISLGTEIVLAVGNNDLSNKSIATTLHEFTSLIELCQDKYPESVIGIMPILPRVGNRDFNKKMKILNGKLYELEADNIKMFENNEISEMECHAHLFQDDGIHFTKAGTVALVRVLKPYLNVKYVPQRPIWDETV